LADVLSSKGFGITKYYWSVNCSKIKPKGQIMLTQKLN
jgi:hypothetical protein